MRCAQIRLSRKTRANLAAARGDVECDRRRQPGIPWRAIAAGRRRKERIKSWSTARVEIRARMPAQVRVFLWARTDRRVAGGHLAHSRRVECPGAGALPA